MEKSAMNSSNETRASLSVSAVAKQRSSASRFIRPAEPAQPTAATLTVEKAGVAIETVYQHGYDELLGRCRKAAGNTSCGTHDTTSYVYGQLNREVRMAVFHAMGVVRWVWS